jgi:hypothetical protein
MRSIAVAAAIVLALPAAAAEHVVTMQQQSYVPANLSIVLPAASGG